ncbi:MAG TPA: hypothetical protein VJ927_02430 [Actinomycetota bacterium]|nr:hypothetical protein [Actinomycetota bacterium]
MLRRKKRAAALLAFAVLTGVLSVGPGAKANHDATLNIQVGAGLDTPRAASMRFLAPRIVNVHRGDQVTFDVTGPHTATLLPADTSAQDWLDENFGLDRDFFYIQPDDEAGAYNDAFASIDEPTDPACGGVDEPTCDFNGAGVLNSGSAFGQGGDPEAPPVEHFTFTAEIDVAQGSTVWVVCLAHPHMRMKINVVDNNSATTTQADIDGAEAAQLAMDNEWAAATHAKMKAKNSSHVGADGRRVVDAWAGVENHHASIMQFYPRKLNLRKGDTVRWHFTDLVYEDHTVSLPIPTIFGINFGALECDPGDGADTPANEDPNAGPPCAEGETVEFENGAEFLFGTGDGVLRKGADMENSGVRGANVLYATPPFHGVDPYDVKFNRTSGERPIRYLCFLHDRMGGSIVVK